MDLTGKVVVITGASRGIGEAAAYAFAQKGASVALLARSEDRISEIAANIGPQAIALACDVSSFETLSTAIDQVVSAFGRVDVLVGNAGVIEPIAYLSEADPDAWSKVIDINLKGIFYGMRACLPGMLAQGGGTIISISSGAAHGPMEAWSHYCASKAGAYMLTRCAHKEYAARGIRALGLSPGTVATQMQREIKQSGINRVSELDWTDHISPEAVAQALIWMCSPDADAHLGEDVSLRDEAVQVAAGLK